MQQVTALWSRYGTTPTTTSTTTTSAATVTNALRSVTASLRFRLAQEYDRDNRTDEEPGQPFVEHGAEPPSPWPRCHSEARHGAAGLWSVG